MESVFVYAGDMTG